MPIVAPSRPMTKRTPRIASQFTFLQLDGRATSRGDLLLGARAERVRRDLKRHRTEFAVTKHLDRLTLADRPGFHHLGRADRTAAREELGETLQVNYLKLDPEVVLEAF